MIYAVIDTNVLVSALLTSNIDAATVRVIEALMKGLIVPLFDKDIIKESPAEMMEILADKK